MKHPKKRFIFISLILISIFWIHLANSAYAVSKLTPEVSQKAQIKNEIPVIIILNQEAQEKTQKEVNEYLEEKDKKFREYNNLISVSVSKEELKELEKIQAIEKIGYSHQIKAFLQDSIPLINASNVWPIQINSANITGIDETICFIDTGINFTHPDLTGKNKTCVIDCYNKSCVENCSIGDDNGHGTHVAGIAAASGGINGVGKNISLIGVKVLDSNGDGHSEHGETDLTNAIDWCIAKRDNYNISVISMSLGTSTLYTNYCDSSFPTLTRAINNATLYNISVIAATGNNGNTTAIASPACIQNTTSIGSVRKDDSTIDYNRNLITDFIAPGFSINSTFAGGSCLTGCSCSGNYMVCTGTSMAAPHAAGAFALFRQFFRAYLNRPPTINEIKANFNSSGKTINDSAGGGYNFRRIDVYAAIDYLRKPRAEKISPLNNSYTNLRNQNVTFTCNTTDNVQLSNVTFHLWNSSSLVYNITQNITGTSNQTNFSYNFSNENSYLWDCIAYNNNSLSNSNSNYTLAYDTTKPQINLISPSSSSTWTSSSTVSFSYNVSDASINNCSLIIDDSIDQTDSLVTVNTPMTFTKSLSNSDYNWSINCTDSAGNLNNSESRILTVGYTAMVVQNNGGGGGGTPAFKTYTITTTQALGGYTQILSKNDKIKFTFFDETTIAHTLNITDITSNSVSLTIQSSIINLKLGIGQSAKLNLTNSDYYNLYIRLNSILNNKADITIQTIHEQILKPGITSNVVKEDEQETTEEIPLQNPQQKQKKIGEYIKNILIVILIIAVLVILFRKKEKIKQERIKEYRKRFRELNLKNKK